MISNNKDNKKMKEKKNTIKKDNIGIDVTNVITNNKEINDNIDKILVDNNKLQIISPYVSIELISNIELEPEQLNNEIYYNIKQNLIKKVEKKCNSIGYVSNIEKIIDYKIGNMIAEDFTGSCLYKIKYQAFMCIPIKDTVIIGKVSKIVKEGSYILLTHGPITIIIQMILKNINIYNFDIQNKKLISKNYKNRTLQHGDYLKIFLSGIKFQNEDDIISCVGKIEEYATDEEISLYYNEYTTKNNINIIEENIKEIEYNEDEMINETNVNKAIIKSSSNYIDI